MDINRVQNTTLAKLTAKEIGELGLLNYGVVTYNGELKSRRQGFKKEVVSDIQTNFLGEGFRVEFIKIQKTKEAKAWAMRVYDTLLETYNVFVHPLTGLDFLK